MTNVAGFESFFAAAISIESALGDVSTNLQTIARWCKQSSAAGAQLCVFPELSVTGFWMSRDVYDVAETVPGPSTDVLLHIAKDYNVTISAGIAELENERVFNTQVVIDPQGYVGKQRKINVCPWESTYYFAGSTLQLLNSTRAPLACAICYDNHFPEIAIFAEQVGARVLIQPYAYGDWSEDWYSEDALSQMEYRVRCRDAGVFGIGANLSGRSNTGDQFGNWCYIIDPFGNYIARTEAGTAGEHMVLGEINPALYLQRLKEKASKYRRPEYSVGLKTLNQ